MFPRRFLVYPCKTTQNKPWKVHFTKHCARAERESRHGQDAVALSRCPISLRRQPKGEHFGYFLGSAPNTMTLERFRKHQDGEDGLWETSRHVRRRDHLPRDWQDEGLSPLPFRGGKAGPWTPGSAPPLCKAAQDRAEGLTVQLTAGRSARPEGMEAGSGAKRTRHSQQAGAVSRVSAREQTGSACSPGRRAQRPENIQGVRQAGGGAAPGPERPDPILTGCGKLGTGWETQRKPRSGVTARGPGVGSGGPGAHSTRGGSASGIEKRVGAELRFLKRPGNTWGEWQTKDRMPGGWWQSMQRRGCSNSQEARRRGIRGRGRGRGEH